MTISPTAPRVLAMLMADSVFYDPEVNKYFVLGTYNKIRSFRFPAVHEKMAIYLAVDYIRSETVLTLRLIDADELRPPIFEGLMPFKSSGPNEVIEIAFRLPIQPKFELPGDYLAEILVDDSVIYTRRFSVVAS